MQTPASIENIVKLTTFFCNLNSSSSTPLRQEGLKKNKNKNNHSDSFSPTRSVGEK
jgi:hypothetical protein